MKRKKTFALIIGFLFLVAISGCENKINKNGAGAGAAHGFIITSDFSIGNLSTITTTTPRTTKNNVLGATGAHTDALIRAFGNLVFIVQRFGSNSILVIDPDNPGAPIANYTTNDSGSSNQQSNPHDMAFVSDSKAYISRYSLNTLLIVNPRTGAQLGTIDLSSFVDINDSDDLVEMDQMVIVGNLLFVSLQRLNNFSADNASYIVVINTDTDDIIEPTSGEQKIVLQGRNPFDMTYLATTDRIYVANVADFSTGNNFGGIEVINPNTLQSEGFILTDNQFNGVLNTIAILSDSIAYAVIADVNFNNSVVPFNLSTQKISPPLSGLGIDFLPSLAFDKAGVLYIADQDTNNPGVQVFDTATDQKIEGPIDTGLPPFEIIFLP
ncbi:MAG: hypothetical protein ACE5G1_04485 [bacterium]